MDKIGKWALIGFDGKVSVLISQEIYTMLYMEACKIAEKLAVEKELVCGMAVDIHVLWDLLKESAIKSNQKIL
jgi:hypothetical protein